MRYLILVLVFLAACSPAPQSTPSAELTAEATVIVETTAEATAELTPEAISLTATPMQVADLPAIELLTAPTNACVNAEDYGQVMGFGVRYYELTTANRVHFRLVDATGTVLDENDGSGENKDGEEAWGFYPLAYEVPADSTLTFSLEVYASMEADAVLTSSSSISFNCTTGEISATSFERN